MRRVCITVLTLALSLGVSAVVRADPGDLILEWGDDGIAVAKPSETTGYNYAESLAVDNEGRTSVVGYVTENLSVGDPFTEGADFAVARFDASGVLDESFGSGGIVVTDLGSNYDYAYDVAIDDQGRIVVVGSIGDPTSTTYA